MFIAQRIIRSKGSNVARLTGRVRTFENLPAMMDATRKARWVFAYVDENGNEGTIRSGKRMRPVDLHVRNTVASGVKQLPLF